MLTKQDRYITGNTRFSVSVRVYSGAHVLLGFPILKPVRFINIMSIINEERTASGLSMGGKFIADKFAKEI